MSVIGLATSRRGAVVLLSAGLIAAIAVSNLEFHLRWMLAIAVLVGALLLGLPGGHPPRWAISVTALLLPITLYIKPPIHDVYTTPWLNLGLKAVKVVAVLVAILPWLPAKRWLIWAGVGLIGACYAMVILGGIPIIDVWYIFRDTANGLVQGRNPYTMMFPDVPPFQTDNCFNYLPATFLFASPGQWLFGDVRWAESAYLLGAVALLAWHVKDNRRASIALVIGILPASMDIVQQSWNEPLLLLGLVAGAVLMERGRMNWAMLPLGLALATKQHLVVLLPLLLFWPKFGWKRVIGTGAVAGAVCLPWFLANPDRFRTCTVDFFLNGQALSRSMSIWQLIPDPFKTVALLLAAALAYAVVLWRMPRTGGGFLIGIGVIMVVWSLFNKQSFVNQYALAAELVIAGIALAPVPKPAEKLDEFPEVAESSA